MLGKGSLAISAVSKELSKPKSGFFVVMATAVAITVFVGFAPTFYLRSTFNPDRNLSILLHVHGFALSAWILLFLLQTILIVRGSRSLHQRLGWVMAGLATTIVVLMGAAIVEQLRRVPPMPPPPFALAFGLFDIIVFSLLVGGAISWRRRADWHKRLMLSATILLVEAAVVRIVAFHGVHEPLYLILSQVTSALLFFIPSFAYDWATRRDIHLANVVGLTLIMMDQILQPIVLSWPAWTHFANFVQRLVA
jgi:uncharacterized membrane protein YozB (DUF420 family)